MKCITISELKTDAAKLDVTQPLTVTQNGNPVMIISSYADYKREQKDFSSLIKNVTKALKG